MPAVFDGLVLAGICAKGAKGFVDPPNLKDRNSRMAKGDPGRPPGKLLAQGQTQKVPRLRRDAGFSTVDFDVYRVGRIKMRDT
jgi:hypothetical protein